MRKLVAKGHKDFIIEEGRINIGRALSNDVSFDEKSMSRWHARLTVQDDGTVMLRDLKSTNGTYVNGVRVEETEVRSGDELRFGLLKMAYVDEDIADVVVLDEEPAGGGGGGGTTTILRSENLAALRGRPAGDLGDAAGTVAPAEPVRDRSADTKEMFRRMLEEQFATGRKFDALLKVLKLVQDEEASEADLLERYNLILPEGADVDRSLVFLTADDGGLRVGAVQVDGEVPEKTDRVNVSPQVPRQVISTGEAVIAKTDSDTGVRHVMAAPIRGRDEVIGVLYADAVRAPEEEFKQDDLDFLAAFADHGAVVIESVRMLTQMRRDRQVQESLSRYLAPGVVDQIVAGGETAGQLAGVKREISILFSDIRDFTGLSERLPPEDVFELLNEYFGNMTALIFEHQGTLDKFIGDAVMAFWGAPVTLQDHAIRSVQSAIAMQKELRKMNEVWGEDGKPHIDIGVGINTGEALAGNLGSDQKVEYTIIADAVNVASRLSDLARGGEILVGPRTAELVQDTVNLRRRDDITKIKGKSEELELFEVVY